MAVFYQNPVPAPQEVAGSNGRPRSMKIAPSMYPRFSQMSEECYSAPQSPTHASAESYNTSQASIYQSALDLGELKSSVDDQGVPNLKRPYSSGYLVENMALTNETTFMPPENVNISPQRPEMDREEPTKDSYFRDGIRKIDFVLTYSTGDLHEELNKSARDIFERNLKEDGLELEYEIETSGTMNFVKIHAPWEVLQRYAEIMKLKMPMKTMDKLPWLSSSASYGNPIRVSINLVNNIMFPTLAEETEAEMAEEQVPAETDSIFSKMRRTFSMDKSLFKPRSKCITTEYQRNKEFLFDIPPDKDTFFSSSERSRIVDFILKRKPFSMTGCDERFAFGITRLLADEVYTAAYPLHEGNSKVWNEKDMRSLLSHEWASLSKIHKKQPLDFIKDYFGVKIGLYFAWLGFYTYMLIPASIVGIGCFIYGIATMYTYVPCTEICDEASNIDMCPLCDRCNYWKLNESCIQSRVTYLVDNPAMLIFAVFMSFWGAIFLELWKRYSALITYNWDLTGFDQSEENPRPEFLAQMNRPNVRVKKNIITQTLEPSISFWRRKFPAVIVSVSIVLLLSSVALIAVIGVIVYRMSVRTILALQYDGDELIQRNAPILTTASAACLNLICILLLNQVYSRIAEKLTEFEMPRTQSDYDDSLTLKMFLLQFVNYYASIFYVAFFKGKLVGFPGYYERLFGYRQEECSPGGCLLELAIQLSIIMVGKQLLNAIMEMVIPVFHRWVKVCKNYIEGKSASERQLPSWERDFQLFDRGSQGLFWEYLEMVLQFGFVTIFVSAFPLAPLFALMNNSFEMRLDGKKFLNLYRRPVARRVPNIGVWYRIMDCIGKFAVITNALIIAFTSNFIPRLVYKLTVSPDGTLHGYVNHSLSYFDATDFHPAYAPPPSDTSQNTTYCRYEDYRQFPSPSDSDHEYERTTYFWYLLVIRLAFVVVFENVVILVITILRWLVPDIPNKVKNNIRRDIYRTNEIMVTHEAAQARQLAEMERKRRSQQDAMNDDTLPSRAPLRQRMERPQSQV